eukprot:TRINITY_DN9975_c0_g1_i1.p1 TRINITY_DN9975_c0_g1~~TRINITY_DN9975_c0_g1_i1.p1  ORF type:complete len:677 (-),score=133.24 TRINITY_DN9975_c0_g1_i1:196-2226(-)
MAVVFRKDTPTKPLKRKVVIRHVRVDNGTTGLQYKPVVSFMEAEEGNSSKSFNFDVGKHLNGDTNHAGNQQIQLNFQKVQKTNSSQFTSHQTPKFPALKAKWTSSNSNSKPNTLSLPKKPILEAFENVYNSNDDILEITPFAEKPKPQLRDPNTNIKLQMNGMNHSDSIIRKDKSLTSFGKPSSPSKRIAPSTKPSSSLPPVKKLRLFVSDAHKERNGLGPMTVPSNQRSQRYEVSRTQENRPEDNPPVERPRKNMVKLKITPKSKVMTGSEMNGHQLSKEVISETRQAQRKETLPIKEPITEEPIAKERGGPRLIFRSNGKININFNKNSSSTHQLNNPPDSTLTNDDSGGPTNSKVLPGVERTRPQIKCSTKPRDKPNTQPLRHREREDREASTSNGYSKSTNNHQNHVGTLPSAPTSVLAPVSELSFKKIREEKPSDRDGDRGRDRDADRDRDKKTNNHRKNGQHRKKDHLDRESDMDLDLDRIDQKPVSVARSSKQSHPQQISPNPSTPEARNQPPPRISPEGFPQNGVGSHEPVHHNHNPRKLSDQSSMSNGPGPGPTHGTWTGSSSCTILTPSSINTTPETCSPPSPSLTSTPPTTPGTPTSLASDVFAQSLRRSTKALHQGWRRLTDLDRTPYQLNPAYLRDPRPARSYIDLIEVDTDLDVVFNVKDCD